MSTNRHNFDRLYPIHTIVKDDYLRPAMEYIQFENGYAYCTDAHIAIRAKITALGEFSDEEVEKLNGKRLHYKHYKEILKYNEVIIEDDSILCCGNSYDPVRFYFMCDKNASGVRFPNIAVVFENALKAEKRPRTTNVGVKTEALIKLSKAIKCDYFEISTEFDRNAILLRKLNAPEDEMLGLIMPIIID